MDNSRSKLLTTAGYIAIGIGFYLIYKGGNFDATIPASDIIEADYTIVED